MLEIYQKYPILIKIINFLSTKNKSNNLPYHGIDHLFEVFKLGVELVNNEKIDNELEFLIACLLHDVNHSGGELSDEENIKNAIKTINNNFVISSEFNTHNVIYLIKATQYPYIIDEENLTNDAKMIRDADMCYMFQDVSIVKLFTGLRTEFKQDLNTFINNQENFYNSILFYSKYCSDRWNNEFKKIRLDELELLNKYSII